MHPKTMSSADHDKTSRAVPPVSEGYIPFHGFRVWYRVVGDLASEQVPILCLHGGPGIAHDYLEPLECLADTGRPVVFYDQLGCGKSDHPHEPALWTMNLFVEELSAVRTALDLHRVHLFGQSWGGMLALEYLLGKPQGVASLILASAPASSAQWAEETGRLRAELPPGVREILDRHEAAGTTDSPEYAEAMMVFYNRHVCRMSPWPDCMMRSINQMMADPEVYFTLWGPSEFYITGKLQDWDVTDRLGEITLPTLITTGRYDEATPTVAETLLHGIRGSRWELFAHSAHAAHIEEADRYGQVLADFITGVETVK